MQEMDSLDIFYCYLFLQYDYPTYKETMLFYSQLIISTGIHKLYDNVQW